jgi:Tfp pilus assembly protein PilO
MTRRSLSRRERTLVVAAVLLAGGIAGYAYLLEPFRAENRRVADLIPAREDWLEQRQAQISQRAALERELGEVSGRVDAERARLLNGPTPAVAAAELQKLVRDMGMNSGMEIRSQRLLTDTKKEGLQEVPIEVTAAGGIRESLNFLYQLERTPKLVTVRDVKLRAASTGQPRELILTISLSGYLLSAETTFPPSGKRDPIAARPRE